MINKLLELLPKDKICNFNYIINGILAPFKIELKNTHQELSWHGEDDVLTHTLMVLKELVNLDGYNNLTDIEKLTVFLAATFHDVGKIVCTKVIDGKIRSYNHGKVGARMVRTYFYKELGFGGNKELLNLREAVCLLIKYHSNPVYSAFDDDAERKILTIAANSELTPLFSIKLLSILSTADVLGRIGCEKEEQVEKINYFTLLANELGVYESYYRFSNCHTKFKFLNKETNFYNDTIYDSSKCEVLLFAGLPGTGKDTYIKNNLSYLPVICLDDIRDEIKVKPGEDESKVIMIAKNRAKEFLRKNISFVWNATNVSNMTRNGLISLFHDYHASVKIIYLETSYNECLIRNKGRIKEVPLKIIEKMLNSLVIPESFEAEIVEWVVV